MSERELPLPPRPAIPTALWALAGACACQLAIGRVSMSHSEATVHLLGMIGGCLCVLAVLGAWWSVRLYRTHADDLRQTLVVVLTCLLCASASACLCNRNGVLAASSLGGSAMSSWHFEVLTDPSPTDTGFRCRARACKEGSPSGDVWLLTKEALARGTAITCIGRFRALRRDSYGISSWCQGVRGSVSVVRITNRRSREGPLLVLLDLRAWVIAQLQSQQNETRALLVGCICGNREALDSCGLTETFATCGLSHMIAVSGSHLATIAFLVSSLLDSLYVRLRLKLFVLGTVTGLFVLFCGCPISAIRSWFMLVVAFASQLSGRRAHAITAVSLVALVMLLVDATVVGQLGFQLSVLSVVGLCLYSQHATYTLRSITTAIRLPRFVAPRLRRAFNEKRDVVCQILSATLVCQLVTMPLCTSVFGRLSLVAPLASLVATPVISVLMGLGLLACLLLWLPSCASLVLALCDLVAGPLLFVVHGLSRLPCAAVSSESFGVPIGMLALLLLVGWLIWWPKVNRRLACTACSMLLLVTLGSYTYWRCMVPARIVVLDVGQGDAILVQDHTSAILIDTGPDEAIVAALARRHVMHLDAVILTHLHDDHYGGLQHLVGTIGCSEVVVARGVADAMPGELADTCAQLTSKPVKELSYENTLTVGGYHLRMIWPRDEVDGDENSESLQLLVAYQRGGNSLSSLLTGDAEQDELASCIEAGDVGDIDVLKVGHHGSEVSLTVEQACAINPELAVASAGEGNRYGHPTQECIDALHAAGARFLCTKDVGDVEVRPGIDGPKVRIFGTPIRELLSESGSNL